MSGQVKPPTLEQRQAHSAIATPIRQSMQTLGTLCTLCIVAELLGRLARFAEYQGISANTVEKAISHNRMIGRTSAQYDIDLADSPHAATERPN